ncbi:drug resistance transporter, EmrB/QacA subfamily [Nocardioides exalbidus]|uniref:Drug resistance transporter, EmrB/QacA subfamily n=1 Tax=Nocardioides exalbidus TaxID=402596 RepID=A0A1H4XEV5_9ACTN|nr:MFS transporter [Nocardioides exalbidus]SED04133.1 drug resistance transporter, EmrB/QacA subfamily [Nocardioides exalbidus]
MTIRSRSAASSTALPDELPPDATRVATGIAIVLVAQLMLVLDATVVNVALPRIDADLGFGPAALSWVLNAYALAFGGLLLLGGRLGDVRGRRRLFLVGLGVFTFASLLGGLAQSPTQLVLARAAQGIGAAMAAPSVLALLTTNAPDEAARNRALALFGAVSSGGASIGLVLGGLLTDVASWRWTLFINVPIGLAVLLLTPRFVHETPRREGRFDVVGALTSTVGAVSVVWALVGAPEHGWLSARTLGMLLVGALSLALLVRTERRHPHPLIRPSLLADRRRVAALVVMGFVIAGQLSMFFLTVQYTQRALGMGPLATGFAFLPFSIGIFTMSRLTPSLLARHGAGRLIPVGAALLLTGFVLLSRVSESSTYVAGVLPSMILSGIGGALVFMPVTATVLSGVEHEHAGSASGLLQTVQQLGAAVGVAIVASVYAVGAEPESFVPGARAAYLTSATFAAIALVVALATLARIRRGAAPAPEVEDERVPVPDLAA